MICHDIRICRRCDPKVTKKITASTEMFQLYSTPDGRLLSYILLDLPAWCSLNTLTSSFWVSILFGTHSPDEKLQQPLIQHGDLKTVEVQLSRWNKTTSNDGNKGRWVTRRYLKDSENIRRFLFESNFLRSLCFAVYVQHRYFSLLAYIFNPWLKNPVNWPKPGGWSAPTQLMGRKKLQGTWWTSTNTLVRQRWRTLKLAQALYGFLSFDPPGQIIWKVYLPKMMLCYCSRIWWGWL